MSTIARLDTGSGRGAAVDGRWWMRLIVPTMP
jgi:hypothetical protein